MVGLKDIRECFTIFIVGCYLQIIFINACVLTMKWILWIARHTEVLPSRGEKAGH